MKRGCAPCSAREARQPPQDVVHVGAEHAAIDVQLVEHHEAQARRKPDQSA